MRRLAGILAATAVAAGLLALAPTASAAGSIGTYFQVYIPPTQDADPLRGTLLVVTAAFDGTTVNFWDDGDDGDTDDTQLNITLGRGQSWLLRIADGIVDDDGNGLGDGDFVIVDADQPVFAQLTTESGWQRDWVPAVSGGMVGRNFFLYSPDAGPWVLNDINVLAHDDAWVEIVEVSTTAQVSSGITQVATEHGRRVLYRHLDEGDDLIEVLGVGADLLRAGHTYEVRASGDVSVQYGALGAAAQIGAQRVGLRTDEPVSNLGLSNSRTTHGGGYVPASNGSLRGHRLLFRISADRGRERDRELLVFTTATRADIALDGRSVRSGEWENLIHTTVTADAPLWLNGRDLPELTQYGLFRLTSNENEVSAFETTGMGDGGIRFADVASAALADQGAGLGTDFQLVVPQPNGLYEGTSQVSVFAPAGDAEVRLSADVEGAAWSRTVTVAGGRFTQVVVTDADWREIATAGNTPIVTVHSLNGSPVTVSSGNPTDSWTTFAPASSSTAGSLSLISTSAWECGAEAHVVLDAAPLRAGGQLLVEVSTFMRLTEVDSEVGEPSRMSAGSDGRTTLVWENLPEGDINVELSLALDCRSNLTGEVLPNGGFALMAAALTRGSANTTALLLPRITDANRALLESLSASTSFDGVEVSFTAVSPGDAKGFQVFRSQHPQLPPELLFERVTAVAAPLVRYHSVDDSERPKGNAYYWVRAVSEPDSAVLGPVLGTVVPRAQLLTFSGDAEHDFAQLEADQGCRLVPQTGNAGGDLLAVNLSYRADVDVLQVGIELSDASAPDPQGVPGLVEQGLGAGRFAGADSLVVVIDTDNDGRGDFVAGTPFGFGLSQSRVAHFDPRFPLAAAPLAFGDTPSFARLPEMHELTSGWNDVEFNITNFASLFAVPPRGTSSFGVWVYMGAGEHGEQLGEMLGSGFLDVRFDQLDASLDVARPQTVRFGEVALTGRYGIGTDSGQSVPMGFWVDGALALDPTLSESSIEPQYYFGSGLPFDASALLDQGVLNLGWDELVSYHSETLLADASYTASRGAPPNASEPVEMIEPADDGRVILSEVFEADLPAFDSDGLVIGPVQLRSLRVVDLDCTHQLSLLSYSPMGERRRRAVVHASDGSEHILDEGSSPVVVQFRLSPLTLNGLEAITERNPVSYLEHPRSVEFNSPMLSRWALLGEVDYMSDAHPLDDVVSMTPRPITMTAGRWVLEFEHWTAAHQFSTRTDVILLPGEDCR